MLLKTHDVTRMLNFGARVCVNAIVREERMMLGYLGKVIMPPCRRMCPLQPKLCLPVKTHRARLKKFSLPSQFSLHNLLYHTWRNPSLSWSTAQYITFVILSLVLESWCPTTLVLSIELIKMSLFGWKLKLTSKTIFSGCRETCFFFVQEGLPNLEEKRSYWEGEPWK